MKLNIKEAREKAGLKQKDLAAKLDVAPSTMAGYESGKHDPGSERLKVIARICGVSIDFLLGREEQEPPEQEPDIDSQRQRAYKIIDMMSDEKVDAFIALHENS